MKKYLILFLFLCSCGTVRYRLEHHDGKLEHRMQWDIIEYNFNILYKKKVKTELDKMKEELKEFILEIKDKYENN